MAFDHQMPEESGTSRIQSLFIGHILRLGICASLGSNELPRPLGVSKNCRAILDSVLTISALLSILSIP